MNAIIVPIILALIQGARSVGAGQGLPPGTKTVAFNFAAVLAWFIARWGLPIPPEVIDPLATLLLALGNLALRAITKGPLGTDTD